MSQRNEEKKKREKVKDEREKSERNNTEKVKVSSFRLSVKKKENGFVKEMMTKRKDLKNIKERKKPTGQKGTERKIQKLRETEREVC